MPSSYRTIAMDGRTWRYKIGRGSVVARSDDLKCVTTFYRLTGAFEDVQITPKHIAGWLRKEMTGLDNGVPRR